MIIGQVGITSLLVLYLYSERGWTAAHAALALGGVQVGAALARVCAGRWSDLRGERVEPFRQLATVAGVLLLAGAVLGPPALMAGGIAAMSWNGLSFTAAAEISGQAAGRARRWGSRTRRCAWSGPECRWRSARWRARCRGTLVFVVMGVAPLVARVILGPLVDDERRRGREREARLESRGHAGGTTSVDPVGP